MGYEGPFRPQCYNIKGDRKEDLELSRRVWRNLNRP